MKVITVGFSTKSYEETKELYEWHKKKVENLKYIWEISNIDPKETSKIDEQNILPMKLQEFNKKYSYYCAQMLGLFQQDMPEYLIFIQEGGVIISKDFEKKSIEYMEIHGVQAMFPFLENKWSSPNHPWSKQLLSVRSKQWTNPFITVITSNAINYYGQSMVQVPEYTQQIRFPTVLIEGDFLTVPNPYMRKSSCYTAIEGGDKRKVVSLNKEEIKKEVNEGCLAVYPVVEKEVFDFIKGGFE